MGSGRSARPKVAAHPEPPLTEKMRILAYLGADATKFRNFDAQTHEAALAMKLANYAHPLEKVKVLITD
jgi:hypothetical protein